VAATGILWDPQSTTYGTLKGVALSLGALTAVIVAGLRVRRGDSWDLRGPLVAVLGLVIWAGISLWWTPSVPAGLGDLAPATAAVILLVAGRVLVRGVGAARLLATAMAGSGMVASIVALAEYSLGHRMISGTIGNPNHLAIYIAATGPALVWLAWSSPHRGPIPLPWRLARLVALLTPLLAAMWLTGCRSAWIAVGVSGLFAGALTRATPRSRWLGLGVATALCLILGAVALQGPDQWRQRLGGRIYLARISSTLIAAGGATGHGVGSFALQFPEHQATRLAAHPVERPLWTNARTAHCEPLHLLAELGPVGGLLMLMVTIFVIGAMVGGRDPPSPQRLVASGGLVILGVSGLAEGSLHAVALLTLATANAALLWEPETNREGGLHRATWVAAVLVFTASALVVTAARTYAADHLMARSHLTAGARQRATLLRRAVHLAPNPGRARFYLGLVQAHHGHPKAAVQTLRQSAADFPNLGTHIALGNALMAQGRIRQAARSYEYAAWLHPRYAAAHHNLGLALKRLGQSRASGASLRRAQRLWPGRWLERWRIRAIRRLIRPAAGPS
jgi:O-antigen ligase